MVNYFSLLYRRLSPLISPRGQCILCGDNGQAGLDLCKPCELELPQYSYGKCSGQQSCYHCALPLLHVSQHCCGRCLQQPPPFLRTVASWVYQPPIAQLITGFKHQRKFSYGKTLAITSLKTIVSAYQHEALPSLIIPTPLHWRRRLKRGFNQSEQLARYYSQQLHIPMQRALIRCRHTPPQQSLHAKQRQQNLHNAFKVVKPIDGQCIALVDDVMTTGSTAREISHCLLKAGAREVHIWCLARTPD